MKIDNPLKRNQNYIGLVVILFIAVVNLLRLFIMIYRGMPNMGDHVWIWTECRIAWYGVSPYKALQEGIVVHGLRTYPHVSTLPWGLVLSTIIHGAFFSLEASKIWYVSLNLIVFAIMLFCVNKKNIQNIHNQTEQFAINMILVSSWYYLDGIMPLNNGMLVCFLIIISICTIDRHEYLVGIIMMFTMIKPQNAIPFFVIFLLLGKWKTIVTSVIGVLVSWGISSIWTQENPIEQLYGVISFASNPEESYHVVGIFDSVRNLGVSSVSALFMSMLTGILLIIISMTIFYRGKKSIADLTVWTLYGIPAIASVMWCYKSNADYLILMIPAIAFFELFMITKNKIERLIYIGCIVLLLTKPFSTALLGMLPFMNAYLCNRLDLYMKTFTLLPLIYGNIKSSLEK